jgi:hypothetical protein
MLNIMNGIPLPLRERLIKPNIEMATRIEIRQNTLIFRPIDFLYIAKNITTGALKI